MARSEAFNSLMVEAYAFGETNDCTVKALVVLTGKSYAEVHAALKAEGRKNRQGASYYQMQMACRRLGFNMVKRDWRWDHDIIATYPGAHKNLKSVTTHHPVRFAKQWAGQPNMLLGTHGHVAAFKDGRIHDRSAVPCAPTAPTSSPRSEPEPWHAA
jgi:hypothetical protein